jgi:hypothetical protein
MSLKAATLVCEGVMGGRDHRWLALVLGELGAGHVNVGPAGSKANLGATVRGMREALTTPRVYAIRDRDFLRAELLRKDEADGVYSLERHCLESYVLEHEVLEKALGLSGVGAQVLALAERRFWPDVARAVLDDVSYKLRRERLHLEEDEPTDRAEVAELVKARRAVLVSKLAAEHMDVEALIDSFELDMRSAPLWTRVNGKELMKSFAAQLGKQVLPGGDLEAKLFTWCSENGPPSPFVAEVKRILERLG